MNKHEITAAVLFYKKFFVEEEEVKKRAYCNFRTLPVRMRENIAFEHCHHMLEEVERLAAENKLDEAMRQLGFVQGVLWMTHRFPYIELESHLYRPANS